MHKNEPLRVNLEFKFPIIAKPISFTPYSQYELTEMLFMVFSSLLGVTIQGFGVFGDNHTDVLNHAAEAVANKLRDSIYAIGIEAHRPQGRCRR